MKIQEIKPIINNDNDNNNDDEFKDTIQQMNDIEKSLHKLSSDSESEEENINDQLVKQLKENISKNSIAIADLNLSIERNQTSIERLYYDLKDLEDKKNKYEENKEAIENFEEFSAELSACQNNLEETQTQHDNSPTK